MPPKIYELTVYRDGRPVRGVNPFLTSVNFDQADTAAAQLNGHLTGAARRDNAGRDDWHHYHLEGRETNRDGKPAGQVLFRWALPDQGTTDGRT